MKINKFLGDVKSTIFSLYTKRFQSLYSHVTLNCFFCLLQTFLVIAKNYAVILWHSMNKSQCSTNIHSDRLNVFWLVKIITLNNAILNLFQSLYKKLKPVQLDIINKLKRTFSPLSCKSGLKPAFSTIEMMLSLIVVSLIMASFTPVITKKLNKTIDITPLNTNQNEYYYGPPRSQKDCYKMNPALMYVQINGVGHCVTKYNTGDFVGGVGYEIPATAGVNVVSVGTTCGATDNFTAKCCWQGATADQSKCDSSRGPYSGCNRTGCTWNASDAICSALGGRLPTNAESEVLFNSYSIGKTSNGLQLCDYSANKGSSQCAYIKNSNTCPGAGFSACLLNQIWLSDENPDDRYRYAKTLTGATLTLDNRLKSYAYSTRCIFDKVQIGECTNPEGCFHCNSTGEYYDESDDTCNTCPKGYFCKKDIKSLCVAGTYNTLTGQGACTICPQNYYCTGGQNKTACPANYISPEGSKTSSDCVANACAAGTYNASTGKTPCTNCGAGYYCTGGKARAACAAGKYATSTTTTSASGCLNCSNGKWSEAGQASACTTNCTAGYACKDGKKTGCTAGKYAAAGSSACSSCASGYNSCANASSCTKCTSSQYWGSCKCNNCPSACTKCTSATNCTACATISHGNRSGTTCGTIKCDSGYVLKNSACITQCGSKTIKLGNLCVSKKNIGDEIAIPSSAGVTTVNQSTGGRCSGNLCCWNGHTAGSCNSDGTYSGCYRTICRWYAANVICTKLGGRLPKISEATSWGANKSLGLCSDYGCSGYSKCGNNGGACHGNDSSLYNDCYPSRIQLYETQSGHTGNCAYIKLTSCSIVDDYNPKDLIRSVRCVWSYGDDPR